MRINKIVLNILIWAVVFSCIEKGDKRERSDKSLLNKTGENISTDSIELVALDFLLDSLFEKKGVLYSKDSFYLNIGLSEELNLFLKHSLYKFNPCIHLITRTSNFSEDTDLPDSIRQQTIGFEENSKFKKNKKLKVLLPHYFKKESLVKELSDSTLFITVRNNLTYDNIYEIEIDVCKMIDEVFVLYVFNFYLDEELRILDWQFYEEVNYDIDCRICFPR